MFSRSTNCLAIAFVSVAATFAQTPAPFLPDPSVTVPLKPGLVTTTSPPGSMTPINAAERLHWLLSENLAPASLLENIAIGGEETLVNSPKEWGTHWTGFGERVGMVTANYGVRTVMEAGLGSMWGEDPRYDRLENATFGARLGHVVKMTFLARNKAGNTMPAYSRFLAIPGSSFLENTWMPNSQATLGDAAVRTGLGFLSRMGENAWKEFKVRR